MNYACEKEILNNFVGRTMTVYHAEDFDENGPYTEFSAVMQGYHLDSQFGLVDVHFQGHKDIEINIDDVMISDDGIRGDDVCGLYFVVDAAA